MVGRVKRNAFSWLAALLLIAAPAFLSGCGVGKEMETPAQNLDVVVTIYPLADILKNLGGEAVSVTCLLPSGSSPHTYEPTLDQAIKISASRLFIYIGSGLDDWVLKLAEAADPDLLVLELTGKMTLLETGIEEDHLHANGENGPGGNLEGGYDRSEHYHGSRDPHIWLDPVIVRDLICPAVVEALVKLDPENEPYYLDNLTRYQAELAVLDREISSSLADLSRRSYVSYHSAWRYFALRYRLHEASVIADFPGQEPSAAWMASLVNLAFEHDIKVIFAEPQLSPAVAEMIAGEINGKVALLDPLGGEDVPYGDTYLKLMRYNAAVFKEALSD